VIAQLQGQIAQLQGQIAQLQATQVQAAHVAPAPVAPAPVEYAPGAANDEPADEADRGLFDSAKQGLRDLVAMYGAR